MAYGDDFLNTTSETRSMKEIIDKLDFIKIKNFCERHSEKKTSTEWEKIFAKTYLIDCYPKYTNNCYNLTIRKEQPK